MVLTSAANTGSPALTICPKLTEPALRARTEEEWAAAEQKATGTILSRSATAGAAKGALAPVAQANCFVLRFVCVNNWRGVQLSLGGFCTVGAAPPQHGRKFLPTIQMRKE
eukprot:2363505-Prymnesium_polylepis.1